MSDGENDAASVAEDGKHAGRKTRVRGGHRAHLTKMCGSIDLLLGTYRDSDSAEL